MRPPLGRIVAGARRRAEALPLVRPLVARRTERRKRERLRALSHTKPPHELRRIKTSPHSTTLEVEDELARLGATDGVLEAGPWTGEAFDELLYWIPFLRWFEEAFDRASGRLRCSTVHGAPEWYPARVSPLDGRESAGRVAPALLERMTARFRRGEAPISEILDRLRFERLPRSPVEASDAITASTSIAIPGTVTVTFDAGTTSERATAATDLISCARAHVGGLDAGTIVALLHGTPTVLLYDCREHLAFPDADLLYRAARRLGTPFVVSELSNVGLLRRIGLGA